MNNTWFAVENNLIDRNDLNIYEKMCSVVLARYAGRAEFSNMLNIQVIAIRMGCSQELAEKALNSLISKKLVTLEDAERIEPEMLSIEAIKINSKVIRSEAQVDSMPHASNVFEHLENFDDEDVKPAAKPKKSGGTKGKAVTQAEFEPEPTPTPTPTKASKRKPSKPKAAATVEPTVAPAVAEKPKVATVEKEAEKEAESKANSRPVVPKQAREGVQELIDQIFEIVDENINDREARIILSFANNDVDLVREKYKIAQRSQVSDKIEMLINELQRKDEPLVKRDVAAAAQNSQIDLENINRMVAFKQSSYAKQSNKPR